MPKQTIAQKSVYWMKVISLGLILGLGIQFAEAWTPPTLPPPNGSVSGPLTTSSVGQLKQGNLALNTDGLYANALLIPSGNVGIGTVNPLAKLHVSGVSDLGIMVSTNDSSNGASRLQLGSRSGQHCGDVVFAESDVITTKPTLGLYSSCSGPGNGDIKLQSGTAGGNVYVPFGNVGIGTVNPTEKLDVSGSAKVTGVLTAGKVQIVDEVVENTGCAPIGLVARDNTGIILSCQGSPLKWKKANGGSGASCPASGQQSGRVYVFDNGSSNGPMVKQCLDGVEYNVGAFAPWSGGAGGD